MSKWIKKIKLNKLNIVLWSLICIISTLYSIGVYKQTHLNKTYQKKQIYPYRNNILKREPLVLNLKEITGDSTHVIVDRFLVNIVDKYFREAIENKVSLKSFQDLDFIAYDYISEYYDIDTKQTTVKLGVCYLNDNDLNYVIINSHTTDLRNKWITVYHEISHPLLNNSYHSEYGNGPLIMTSVLTSEVINEINKNPDSSITQLFKYIKNNQ